MQKTPNRSPSLLAQQLTVLGLASGDAEAAGAERARIEGIELASLTLAGAQRSRKALHLALALAASLALLVVSYRLLTPGIETDDLRVKGASKVWVYWERDGQVEPWSEDADLQNGDRVRAEVLAVSDAVAYLAVVSGDGVLLSDPEQVRAGAMRLTAGERKSFSGSIKLVGVDEKERLVVIVCHLDGGLGPNLSVLFKGRGEKVEFGGMPKNCGVEQFALRGSSK